MVSSTRKQMTSIGTLTVLIIILVCPALAVVPGSRTCEIRNFDTSKTYTYLERDIGLTKVCIKCPPGSYRLPDRHCSVRNSIDHCRCCPVGQFKFTYDQATSCETCSSDCLYHNARIVAECSPIHDLICECVDGFFFFKELKNCFEHAACEPGAGVRFVGNKQNDTTCMKCEQLVSFSNTTSKIDECRFCTDCREDEEVLSHCTAMSDTICKIAHTESKTNWRVTVGVLSGSISVALILLGFFIYRCRRSICDREDPKGMALTVPFDKKTLHSYFNIIENSDAAKDWKTLGRNLDVPEHELDAIDTDNRQLKEKCRKLLNKWYTMKGQQATVDVLVGALRQSDYNVVADDIQREMGDSST